jgi:hypothetical protein
MGDVRITRKLWAFLLAAAIFLPAGAVQAQLPCLPGSDVICVNQGTGWTNAQRKAFYSTDQGSQMIPYAWAKALKTPEGAPFMGDRLVRYGYLPDDFRSELPVGFTLAGTGLKAQLGMTCAACHTREIARDEFRYRVDGGPAIVDFQALLTDMVDAVGRALQPDQFDAFASAVLGPNAGAAAKAQLKTDVGIWYERENTLKLRAYGTPDMWGLGRLDAVSMIFNRLTGLDLGPAPTYLIPANIRPADAPVRYPFLWNAAKQDITQWPGFSGNGTAVMGLARNTGEVYGVFGTFHPVSPSWRIGNVNFTDKNSSNWTGLRNLEKLIKKIGTPQWPTHFPRNKSLDARGEQLYRENCVACHALNPVPAGKPGFPNVPTWATPLQNVGTDTREYVVLQRKSDPGVLINLKSALDPSFKVTNPACDFDLLKYSVLGGMVQSGAIIPALADDIFASIGQKKGTVAGATKAVDDSFPKTCAGTDPKYESRVMFGVWAAAPYLHNGSVPTLDALLTPPDLRPKSFAVGPNFDPYKIGLAETQPGAANRVTRVTTGCEDKNSGNSRCGHDFGTALAPDDKRALLEFLKSV